MYNLLWYHLGKQHGGGSGGGGGSEPTVNTVELLKSTTFTGFAPDSDFLGLYTCTRLFGENGLEAFQFVVGDNYTVVWDNVTYKVTAKDASALSPGIILVGNGEAIGLGSNNEPFAIGWFGTGISLLSSDSLDTHTVRIYQTVLDNTEVRSVGLDATQGIQIIKPSEDGKSMSETIITMPDTLIPENIAEGVGIGGIIGTLAAGGGSVKCKFGTFIPSATYDVEVTHNLGVTPDIIAIFLAGSASTTGQIVAGYSLSKARFDLGSNGVVPTTIRKYATAKHAGAYAYLDESTGAIHDANATTFKCGNSSHVLAKSVMYYYMAVGGLT